MRSIFMYFLQEQDLKKAKQIAEEAERSHDEIRRKLAVVEADLERAEERADEYSSKFKAAEADIFRLTEGKSF